MALRTTTDRFRVPARVALAILAGALLVGCDPGWYVTVRNSSRTDLLVRVTEGTSTQVFRIPPSFDGIVMGGIGEDVAVKVDLLEPNCRVIATGSSSGRSVAITIQPELGLEVRATAFPDRVPDTWAVEIKGQCGSTRPSPGA